MTRIPCMCNNIALLHLAHESDVQNTHAQNIDLLIEKKTCRLRRPFLFWAISPKTKRAVREGSFFSWAKSSGQNLGLNQRMAMGVSYITLMASSVHVFLVFNATLRPSSPRRRGTTRACLRRAGRRTHPAQQPSRAMPQHEHPKN
mmetsp:Transcript_5258/g.10400  ORF Transcript_5258/g.10400 Transcript_5258/m.10400 type:complete len:145 (-) Transcript_5258:54-488(-)